MTKCVVCNTEKPDERIWLRCACNHPVCQMCFLRRPEETEKVMAKLHGRDPR